MPPRVERLLRARDRVLELVEGEVGSILSGSGGTTSVLATGSAESGERTPIVSPVEGSMTAKVFPDLDWTCFPFTKPDSWYRVGSLSCGRVGQRGGGGDAETRVDVPCWRARRRRRRA